MLDLHAVMLDQRMLLQRRRLDGYFRFNHAPFVLRSFDKDRDDRRGDLPTIVLSRIIKILPIALCRRQQRYVSETAEVHSQAACILKKQLRMRTAGDEPARLFFI